MITRRQWLLGVGVAAGAAAQSASGRAMSEREAHKTQKRALDSLSLSRRACCKCTGHSIFMLFVYSPRA